MILDYVAISTVVKTIVDGIKLTKVPKWALPLIAISLGAILTPILTGNLTWQEFVFGFTVGAGGVGTHEMMDQIKKAAERKRVTENDATPLTKD